jgi:hypothetical protein
MRNEIVVPETQALIPAQIAAAGEEAGKRFLEFFTANIRNRNTRTAYAQAVGNFFRWCGLPTSPTAPRTSRSRVNASFAGADGRVETSGYDPHRDRLAGQRVGGIDPKRGERRVHRALEHRHQVRLPLISTRGRVQIGSGFDARAA